MGGGKVERGRTEVLVGRQRPTFPNITLIGAPSASCGPKAAAWLDLLAGLDQAKQKRGHDSCPSTLTRLQASAKLGGPGEKRAMGDSVSTKDGTGWRSPNLWEGRAEEGGV